MKKLGCFSIAALLLFLALPIANSFASGNEEWGDKSCFDGSRIPGYPDVIGEYLQIPGTDAPGTPHVLNTAAFLRVRTALDGDRPKPANAIVVAQPGFSSLPTHWLYLAAQLVNKASQRTCDGAPCRVEVWVMDRRGSNLEDTVGLRQARVKYDPEVALDYYFGPSVLTDPKLASSTGQLPADCIPAFGGTARREMEAAPPSGLAIHGRLGLRSICRRHRSNDQFDCEDIPA